MPSATRTLPEAAFLLMLQAAVSVYGPDAQNQLKTAESRVSLVAFMQAALSG